MTQTILFWLDLRTEKDRWARRAQLLEQRINRAEDALSGTHDSQ
jgi:hypothetical protein